MGPGRIRPGYLMPSELERERQEVKVTVARMMRRHARYRRTQAVRAFLRRLAAGLSLKGRDS
jgi:hypothetical protein